MAARGRGASGSGSPAVRVAPCTVPCLGRAWERATAGAAAVAAAGGLLAVPLGPSVLLVDTDDLEARQALPLPPGRRSTCVAWSPPRVATDAGRSRPAVLAVGDAAGDVHLFDAGASQCLATLVLPEGDFKLKPSASRSGQGSRRGTDGVGAREAGLDPLRDEAGVGHGGREDEGAGGGGGGVDGQPRRVVDVVWMPRTSRALCVLTKPSRVSVWSVQSMDAPRLLWSRDFPFRVSSMLCDPFDERRHVVCSSDGWIQSLRHAATDRPLKEANRYRIAGRDGSVFMQAMFCHQTRNAMWFLLPTEMFLFDTERRVTLRRIQSRGANFRCLLPAPHSGDTVLAVHVGGDLSVWRPMPATSAAVEGRYSMDTVSTLLPPGGGTTIQAIQLHPFCNTLAFGVLSSGALVKWRLSAGGIGHSLACAAYCSDDESESDDDDGHPRPRELGVRVVRQVPIVRGAQTCVAVSPADNTRWAVGTSAGYIYVFSMGGVVRHCLSVHDASVTVIAWADPDATSVLSAAAGEAPSMADVRWTHLPSGRTRRIACFDGVPTKRLLLREPVKAATVERGAGGVAAGRSSLLPLLIGEDEIDDDGWASDDSSRSSSRASQADSGLVGYVREIVVSPNRHLCWILHSSMPPELLLLRTGRIPRRVPCAGSPPPANATICWLQVGPTAESESWALCAKRKVDTEPASRTGFVLRISVDMLAETIKGQKPTTGPGGVPRFLAASVAATVSVTCKVAFPDASRAADATTVSVTAVAYKDGVLAVGNDNGVLQFGAFDWKAVQPLSSKSSLLCGRSPIKSMAFSSEEDNYQVATLMANQQFVICDADAVAVLSSSAEVHAEPCVQLGWAAPCYPFAMGLDGQLRVLDLSLSFSAVPVKPETSSNRIGLLPSKEWALLRSFCERLCRIRGLRKTLDDLKPRERDLLAHLAPRCQSAIMKCSASPHLLALATARMFHDAPAVRTWLVANAYLNERCGNDGWRSSDLPYDFDLVCSPERVRLAELALQAPLRDSIAPSAPSVPAATFSDDEDSGASSSDEAASPGDGHEAGAKSTIPALATPADPSRAGQLAHTLLRFGERGRVINLLLGGPSEVAAAPSRAPRRTSTMVGVSYASAPPAGKPVWSAGEWNALKACLVAAVRGGDTLQTTAVEVASSLAASGHLDEAVDMMCLVDHTFEACLMLQQAGRWRDAAVLAKAMPANAGTAVHPGNPQRSYKQGQILRTWADHLIRHGRYHVAVELLMSVGEFAHAAVLLCEHDDTAMTGSLLLDACVFLGIEPEHPAHAAGPVDSPVASPSGRGGGLSEEAVFVAGAGGALRMPADATTSSARDLRKISAINVARYLQALGDEDGAHEYLEESALE